MYTYEFFLLGVSFKITVTAHQSSKKTIWVKISNTSQHLPNKNNNHMKQNFAAKELKMSKLVWKSDVQKHRSLSNYWHTRCRCVNAVSFYAEMKSLLYMFALASNKLRWKRKSLCARFCELVKFGQTKINLNDRAFLVFIYNEKSSSPNHICLTYKETFLQVLETFNMSGWPFVWLNITSKG